MIRFFCLTLIFWIGTFAANAASPRFHGSLRNSVYAYQDDDRTARVYQLGRVNWESANRQWRAYAGMRLLTDLTTPLPSDERYRLYSAKVEGSFLRERVDVSLGRLFLHPGAVLGVLDGVTSSAAILPHLRATVYGGRQAPVSRLFGADADEAVFGGVLQYRYAGMDQVQVIFQQKQADGNRLRQWTGINWRHSLSPLQTLLQVQAHYDGVEERWHRLLGSVRQQWTERLRFSLHYKRQFPQIDANSYFQIFTPLAFQRYRVSAAYALSATTYLEARYQFIDFDIEQARQVFVNLNTEFGTLGFFWEDGAAGDQLGVVADVFYEIYPNLVLSGYADYTRYRTERIYEFEQQLANALRVSYRFNRHWLVDLEYQYLTDKSKVYDYRFLNHVTFRW